jgi:hypothetical protein
VRAPGPSQSARGGACALARAIVLEEGPTGRLTAEVEAVAPHTRHTPLATPTCPPGCCVCVGTVARLLGRLERAEEDDVVVAAASRQLPGRFQADFRHIKMPGRCLVGAWNLPGSCLEAAWKAAEDDDVVEPPIRRTRGWALQQAGAGCRGRGASSRCQPVRQPRRGRG